MRFLQKAQESGFTLVEMMVSMTIVLMFLTTFMVAFAQMRRQFEQQNNYFQTNRTVRYALDKISKDVKEALAVVSSYNSNTTSDSLLILQLPSLNASGEPSDIDADFDYVTYRVSSGKLLRDVDVKTSTYREGGVDVTGERVAENVGSITFSYNGTGLGSVSSTALATVKRLNTTITASIVTSAGTQTTESDSEMMLRNRIV